MIELTKQVKGWLKEKYVGFYYLFRKIIRWKKVSTIYLRIDDPLISKKVFANIAFGDYEIDENKILQSTLCKDDFLLEL